jgi:hypothetical protein
VHKSISRRSKLRHLACGDGHLIRTEIPGSVLQSMPGPAMSEIEDLSRKLQAVQHHTLFEHITSFSSALFNQNLGISLTNEDIHMDEVVASSPALQMNFPRSSNPSIVLLR